MAFNAFIAPETIHPSLWRASQLARGTGVYVASGHTALSAELPGGGWPGGALTEILIQHRARQNLAYCKRRWRVYNKAILFFCKRPIRRRHLLYPNWVWIYLNCCGYVVASILMLYGQPNKFCAAVVALPYCSGKARLKQHLCDGCIWLHRADALYFL